eukprot:6324499-Pyramimonas_sp.AAC.1
MFRWREIRKLKNPRTRLFPGRTSPPTPPHAQHIPLSSTSNIQSTVSTIMRASLNDSTNHVPRRRPSRTQQPASSSAAAPRQ